MALMERVATLLRANLNDLIDRAEDPEKMIRQLVLDIENQLLQVKTQVAIALTGQHLLEKKALDQEQAAANWHRKAELAVSKGRDDLARAALECALSHETLLEAFRTQVNDQAAEAGALRGTYAKLQSKLAETQAQGEVLIAQHRRARMVARATEAKSAAEKGPSQQAVSRLQDRLDHTAAKLQANNALAPQASLEERFAALEQTDRIEQLLADLKSKQQRLLPTG